MKDLRNKLGEMTPDGLIYGIVPTAYADGRVIACADQEVTYLRGTLFGRSEANGMISPYKGEEGTYPDCILCDDVTVGTELALPVTVYTGGCFNGNRVTVAEGYALTIEDLDQLRMRGIVFHASQE